MAKKSEVKFTKKDVKETIEKRDKCLAELKALYTDFRENGGKPEHLEKLNKLNLEFLQLSNKAARIEMWVDKKQDERKQK